MIRNCERGNMNDLAEDYFDAYLDISGIQHFCFCKKQWALIYIEQQWIENEYTAEGRIIHEKCHNESINEKRGNVIISRGMKIHSNVFHIKGICDVVEFHKDLNGVPIFGKAGLWGVMPIEYKRGAPKINNSDRLQLCCQAVCLEEMMCCDIDFGYLYYHSINKREKVIFDDILRSEMSNILHEMRRYYESGHTPSVRKFGGCDSCSLNDICLPKTHNISVSEYLEDRIREGRN